MKDKMNDFVAMLTDPNRLKSLHTFVRVDLSLKQRRETELKTRRPAARPRVVPSRRTRDFEYVDAVDAVVPVTCRRIAALDYDGTLDRPGVASVRVKALGTRSVSLRRAALLATEYYLTGEEAPKLAVRIASRLNVQLFGGKARRRRNPMKLPALVCLHDKHTRLHLPMVFGLPVGVTIHDFKRALRIALAKEPFVFTGAVDDARSCKVEEVKDLAASVRYNANDAKSLNGASVVYVHAPTTRTGENVDAIDSETRHAIEHPQRPS